MNKFRPKCTKKVKGVRSPNQLKNNALTKPQIYDFLGRVRQSKFKTYMEKDLSTEYSESKTLQKGVSSSSLKLNLPDKL